MAEILSQKQIDDLLANLESKKVDINEIGNKKKVKEYDFMSPKQFSRGQLKLLETVFDDFVKMFSNQLTGMFRTACRMEVLQVEEEKYRDFNNALSDSVLVAIIGMHNEKSELEGKQILMELSRQVSFAFIDRMLGGNGGGFKIDRDYTDIELSLLDYLFKQMMPFLKSAWSDYMKIDYTLDAIATNSRLLQFIQPDESVAIVVVEITLDELKGNMNICLPASSLEDIFRVFNSKYIKPPKKENPDTEQQRKVDIMSRVKSSSLTVAAILGQAEISLKELYSLQVGDVILLNTFEDKNAIVLNVEGVPWFTGVIGTKREKYAVMIEKSI
ncbi:MAG: flagellar motor switch protein FliM [Clostridia bacterium]|nr:flagellar motor switch protein FliM [Clostridia bacterium]